MNWAASPLADSKELLGAVQNEGLLRAESSSNKENILGLKADWLWKDCFPSEDGGVCQNNYLTSTDHVIPNL